MDRLKTIFPILAALISAIALLAGYAYQKNLEQAEEIRKTRQQIYSHLISNITERNALLGRLEQSPELLKANSEERSQLETQLQLKDSELSKNEATRTEVIASLCLYGTDDAIDAYAKYAKANVERKGGDLGELILALRRSIYETSHITADEANLTIWNDPKYLMSSSSAK
jgi:hypothetical protein